MEGHMERGTQRPSTAGISRPTAGTSRPMSRLATTPRPPPSAATFHGVLRGPAAASPRQQQQSCAGDLPDSLTPRENSCGRTFRADFHRKVQHVPCAREVQLALRARLLELELCTMSSEAGRDRHSEAPDLPSKGLGCSAVQPSRSEELPFASGDVTSSSDSDGDSDAAGVTPPRGHHSAAGSRATVQVAAPSPPPAPRQQSFSSRPSTGMTRTGTSASSSLRRRHRRMPKFSTNFRIDSSWNSNAYAVQDYFETQEFKKVIAPRVERLSAAPMAYPTYAASASGQEVGTHRHTVPLPRDDRITEPAKDAVRYGRHKAPFVIPFPLANSLRQPDTVAELFVAEQQESRNFREMIQLNLRPPVPASVAKGLFSPRRAKEDEKDFLSQDELHMERVREKVNEAMRKQAGASSSARGAAGSRQRVDLTYD